MTGIIQIIYDLAYKGLESFGKYYSSYRGFVVNREDPEGYGRVKLSVPDVFGVSSYDYWAWPKNCYSGKGYGSQIIPQKGELVWVEFEMGNPSKPIYSLGHFGKNDQTGEKEKPAEIATNFDNFWFKTPNGNSIELDDKNKLIRFTDANGNIFKISSEGFDWGLNGGKINLGQEGGANEPAVKGDKNIDALKALKDRIDSLHDKLLAFCSTEASATASTPLTPMSAGFTKLATDIGLEKAEMAKLNLVFEKTKSITVTLD